jgi:hypothetical protein
MAAAATVVKAFSTSLGHVGYGACGAGAGPGLDAAAWASAKTGAALVSVWAADSNCSGPLSSHAQADRLPRHHADGPGLAALSPA